MVNQESGINTRPAIGVTEPERGFSVGLPSACLTPEPSRDAAAVKLTHATV